MNEYKMSVIMIRKLRPVMGDLRWIELRELSDVLKLKSVKFRDLKEARFIMLVNELYKELED